MPIESLRDYLPVVEKHGFMKRVTAEVDRDWEIGAVIRNIYETVPAENRYGVYFERVKGSQFPFVVGIVGPTRETAALVLEAPQDKLMGKMLNAFEHPIEPVIVAEGPCQENVLTGDQVDLNLFPFPTYSAGRDGGNYIIPGCIISKDPETGVRNSAVYRSQIIGKNRITFGAGRVKGAYAHYAKQEAIGKGLDIAISIGVDPVIWFCGPALLEHGIDELSIAGALRRKPVELVKCKTVDLEVPANAEIVIEGVVLPKVRGPEGPFGEAAGYMEGVLPERPVVEIKCITYRNNAICQGNVAQKPPNEAENAGSLMNEALLMRKLTKGIGLRGIVDLAKLKGAGMAHLVIKVKKLPPGQNMRILNAAWVCDTLAKYISVVDEDIDIRNTAQVLWAHAYRCQPKRDIKIVEEAPQIQDPSTGTFGWRPSNGSKMLIDATMKFDYPDVAMPAPEFMEKVKNDWAKYGLPLTTVLADVHKPLEVSVQAPTSTSQSD